MKVGIVCLFKRCVEPVGHRDESLWSQPFRRLRQKSWFSSLCNILKPCLQEDAKPTHKNQSANQPNNNNNKKAKKTKQNKKLLKNWGPNKLNNLVRFHLANHLQRHELEFCWYSQKKTISKAARLVSVQNTHRLLFLSSFLKKHRRLSYLYCILAPYIILGIIGNPKMI